MSKRSPEVASASVATTWAISVDQLRREEPRAVDLLNLCAFLAPEPIPRSLLAEHHDALPPNSGQGDRQPATTEPSDWRAQAVPPGRGCRQGPDRASLCAGSDARPTDRLQAPPLGRGRGGADARGFPYDQDDPATWAPSGALLAHALAAAGHAEETAKDLEDGEMAARTRLPNISRRAPSSSGARAGFARALGLAEAALGPDHPEVATYVNNLGEVLHDLGDLAGAGRPTSGRSRSDEKSFGPDHPRVAERVNNLASVLQDLGDLAGARAAFERALPILEKDLGPDHPKVAILLNNLGGVLKELGELAGAKAAFERALAIDEKSYRTGPPHVATFVSNLGGVLKELGRSGGRQGGLRAGACDRREGYGPDHPTVATFVNNLGSVLQDLGELAGARAAYERALAIGEKSFGPDHPDVATDVNNLAWCCRTWAIWRAPGRPSSGRSRSTRRASAPTTPSRHRRQQPGHGAEGPGRSGGRQGGRRAGAAHLREVPPGRSPEDRDGAQEPAKRRGTGALRLAPVDPCRRMAAALCPGAASSAAPWRTCWTYLAPIRPGILVWIAGRSCRSAAGRRRRDSHGRMDPPNHWLMPIG